MKFRQWEPIYKKILSDFSFSEKKDHQASILLNTLLQQHPQYYPLSTISHLIKNKTIVIIGAASHSDTSIKKYKEKIVDTICIAADGITTALLQQNIIPDIIVSDLDGYIPDLIYANKKGSILVVHAHGDNINTLNQVVPNIPNKVSGTIQTNPASLSYVENVGGFTDGDRAVYLADHFNAKSILLLNFDFYGSIGEYSYPQHKNLAIKWKKLLWAEKLISIINTHHHIHFLD